MANLKEEEVRRIVNRATMFQKFYGSSTQAPLQKLEEEYSDLFEITDSLKLERAFVCEALLEFQGIPVDEPLILDAGFNDAQVLGFSTGNLTPETLKELRAQIEYHYNTVGEIKHRKTKTVWKSKPEGLSRFISSYNSLEVIFEESNGAIKILAKQSMKTFNKLYIPALIGVFASIMMLAAGVFGEMGNEAEVGAIMMSIFGFLSFLYARSINKRKQKKKWRIVDLIERLQEILERRKRVSAFGAKNISISDGEEYSGLDEIEINERDRSSTK